ncbi:hypothetical protein BT96DRAFT_869540, partial [Gymnopus androsaceus JB14]
MSTFIANRKLLNPKFEGYKFDFIDQDQFVSRHPLQHPATQATTSTQTWLSFHEVQSRISHNHLTVVNEGTSSIYVDQDYNVVLISIAPETLSPSFRIVYELAKPISSTQNYSEYPSAAYISSELLFVSDGNGFMYLLRTSDSGPFQLAGLYQLMVDESAQPFLIRSVDQVSPDTGIAILSSRHRGPKPEGSTRKTTPVDFDIWAVKFDLSVTETTWEAPRAMNILWHRRGDQVPILSKYDSSRDTFMLIGGSSYRDLQAVVPPPYQPSSDEIAPIPRAGENLDSMQADPAKPPPYSWTQSSDSVTVAFPLPSSTPKSAINIKFSPTSLSLSITESAPASVLPLTFLLVQIILGWYLLDMGTRRADHSYGLLTLYLDKQHEGTKWMQVFASSGKSAAAELSPEDAEVPETLDPSELWLIRESLEKYTAALLTGEDA